jgi:3-oxoacyl-[acyl-carrier-protein] synthase II
MSKKRIVVTGLGLVSCFGTDPDRFYDRLLAGESGVREVDKFRVDDMPTRFAAFVRDFDPEGYVDRKQVRRADIFVTYGLYAGMRALEQAGLKGEALEALDKTRCGVIVGSGMGGMEMYYSGVKTLEERGVRRVSPFFVPYIITNMAGGLLATEVGFQGPNYSISTACATATHSVIAAANHIRNGDADVMLAGGVEATGVRITMAGFVACRAMSERNDDPEGASRPWDKSRDGFVMGEGCGVVVLESLEHALARGAPILGEYLGGGISCDAYHMTNIRPDGSGIGLCIDNMIRDAGIEKERINYINAHATSTPLGDMAEVEGIKRAFGEHRKNMRMNATKSLIGHCLGGAGAVELVATLKAIERNKLHPTINLKDPEEGLDMDVVRDEAQDFDIDVALSNSFGFGGHNACIAVSAYRD